MTSRKILFTTLAVLLALTVSCAPVKPWQRGTLVDPIMQANRAPLARSLSDHVYFSREAASGGQTAEAAGCGCN